MAFDLSIGDGLRFSLPNHNTCHYHIYVSLHESKFLCYVAPTRTSYSALDYQNRPYLFTVIALPIISPSPAIIESGGSFRTPKMIHAIKSIRTQSPSPTITPSLHLSSYLSRKASRVGFRQASAKTQSTVPDSEPDMDENLADNPHKKSGDVMSQSFGEAYATRCEDDGFGGIYGGNQSVAKVEQEQLIHENHPDYDRTQGSEVTEKEKARHQKEASTN